MTAYRLISAEKARTPVSVSCRLLGVSRSGYYEWAANARVRALSEDAELVERIARSTAEPRRLRLAAHPRRTAMAHGIRVGRKRVERLMREARISGMVRRKRGHTTISVPGVRVADDLVERQFRPAAPNVLWVADVTYLRTWEGWLYLAAVQDAYSRAIVGWRWPTTCAKSSSSTRWRWPSADAAAPGLIHHSDQGSQYVSLAFGQAAREAGIARSMGSKGDCYDDAVTESFFATLKKELVRRRSWPTRHELTSEVFEYIEAFYNRVRRHSTLGMLAPLEFENRTLFA